MLNCFVKKFHADPHPNKIICCKPGHECLFPTAVKFYYSWQDIPDEHKAGVAQVSDEEEISQKVKDWLPTDNIEFVSLSEVGWSNKHDYEKYVFIPQSKHNLGLKTDIVITPRNRKIDAHRNWKQNHWQAVVNTITQQGYTVGVCGTRETSFELVNIACRSYDHIDVDSDVEMMNNTKLVVTQETGTQYLSFLCKRPTICIGNYQGDGLHKDPDIFFRNVKAEPSTIVQEILNYLVTHK